jgi:DNA-binding MarR family transcriptional regulator
MPQMQGKNLLITKGVADIEWEAESGRVLVLGEFLPYRLSVLAESVSRAFAQHYERRFGISIPEWRVMAVLGERSPQSTQEVIGRTRMDRVKVSRAAIRLEDKKLIARTPLPGDQRAHNLRLSRRGLAMYHQIVPIAHALQAELLRALGNNELRAFDASVGKLLNYADRLASVSENDVRPSDKT